VKDTRLKESFGGEYAAHSGAIAIGYEIGGGWSPFIEQW